MKWVPIFQKEPFFLASGRKDMELSTGLCLWSHLHIKVHADLLQSVFTSAWYIFQPPHTSILGLLTSSATLNSQAHSSSDFLLIAHMIFPVHPFPPPLPRLLPLLYSFSHKQPCPCPVCFFVPSF